MGINSLSDCEVRCALNSGNTYDHVDKAYISVPGFSDQPALLLPEQWGTVCVAISLQQMAAHKKCREGAVSFTIIYGCKMTNSSYHQVPSVWCHVFLAIFVYMRVFVWWTNIKNKHLNPVTTMGSTLVFQGMRGFIKPQPQEESLPILIGFW